MSYCTIQSLIDRFGEKALIDLTDRGEEASGEIATAVVDAAIANAGAMIDGYLAPRYALPLATTPALVADLALIVTFYKLHGEVVAEKVRSDYQDALKQLKDLSNGVIRLDVAGVEPAAAGTSGVRTNQTRPRDMTPGNMGGLI